MGRRIGKTWVASMVDFFDEDGRLAPLSGPGRRLAEHFGAIVASVSNRPLSSVSGSGVRCRRRPGRRLCPGEIRACLDADGSIGWECPICDDNGVISEWRGTLWDSRRAGAPH